MFEKQSKDGYRQLLAGIWQKTLVYGDRTLMAEFLLHKDAILPLHSHPHEQTGYLVRGRVRLTIGESVHEVSPGDSWCIPGDMPHAATGIEESLVLEVFSPVREDYLSATL